MLAAYPEPSAEGQKSAPVPLGNIAKFSSPYDEVTAERFRLQALARRLVPCERVGKCLRCLLPLPVPGVDVWRKETRVRLSGLERCGSVWMCAPCAARITEARRVELAACVEAAAALHLVPYLRTLTFRHYRRDSLADSLQSLIQARDALYAGKAGQSAKARFGVVGSVTALEVTYGDNSGWHPHLHTLVFLPVEVNSTAFATWERDRWSRAAARHGLTMNDHGYKLQTTGDAVADYVAKFGDDVSDWSVAHELAKAPVKRGRRPGRFSPTGLLALSDDSPRYGHLWREYALTFKGRHQLQYSHGLRELLGVGQEARTDAEIVTAAADEGYGWLGHVSAEDWRRVVGSDARAEFVRLCRHAQEWAEVAAFLESL